MNSTVRRLVVSALMVCVTGAMAAPVQLAGLDPYKGGINGVQSDGSTPPAYTQGFTGIKSNSTLDLIVWWGYRLNDDSNGTAPDNFEVTVDGVVKSGSLSVATDGDLQKYTLDIADELLTGVGGTLGIFNDGAFEWYWQGIDNRDFGTSDTFPVAFRLLGSTENAVPEPSGSALLGIAGIACGVASRRRKAQVH
ncbi:MAG: PEP-CTERM sorting domain-containing protein [Pseudomonadota bacterium]|nr:PEP-CTERM sorting domain-containing protein [Pseudomonadota bacterium]